MNINKGVMKSEEGKSLKELADAPVAVLESVTESDAEHLRAAFNVKTVRDLANLKPALRAQAIVALSDLED